MPTGGIVGRCSLPAGHFGHGPRPKLFPLAEHPIRNRASSGTRNRWKSMTRQGAPLPATCSLLFTLAGAFHCGTRTESSKSVSGSDSSKGPRVCCVRLGFVRFRIGGVLELERKRSTFSRHPFRYLRMRHPSPRGERPCAGSRTRRGQYWKTVVDNSGITASREIGRNISFRCAFFRYL